MEKRILIVDDDPIICQLLCQLLEFDGYAVDVANNGVEGIDKTRLFEPHLIVMDYMMPKLDGLAACEAITDNPLTSHIPIIMLSAHSNVNMPQLAVSAGAALFLDKSGNIPMGLLEAVDELLNGEDAVPSSNRVEQFVETAV